MRVIDKKELRKLIRGSVDARRSATFIEVGTLIIISVGIIERVTQFFMQSKFWFTMYRNAIFVILLCYGLYIMVEGISSRYRVYEQYASYELCEGRLDKINYKGQFACLGIVVLKENGETDSFKTCPIYDKNNILNPDVDDYYGKYVLFAYNKVTKRCIVIKVIEYEVDDGIIHRYI